MVCRAVSRFLTPPIRNCFSENKIDAPEAPPARGPLARCRTVYEEGPVQARPRPTGGSRGLSGRVRRGPGGRVASFCAYPRQNPLPREGCPVDPGTHPGWIQRRQVYRRLAEVPFVGVSDYLERRLAGPLGSPWGPGSCLGGPHGGLPNWPP
jgi:hypothetical protein